MGFVPKWSRGNHKKTSPTTSNQGVRQMPSLFHGVKDAQFSAPALFADGGEVSEAVLKSEGLKASEGEKIGFFDRLKMGNIDDPESEAYRRLGAGRGRQERDMAMAERQMDDLDARKAAAKVETFPLADNRVESDAEASQRENMRNAEMTRLMNQAKKEVRRSAPVSNAVSKPVDYSSAPNESSAETARLVEANRRAAERKEVPRVGMVSPRPRMNFSSPADRARWDEKYGKTHNPDGMPK